MQRRRWLLNPMSGSAVMLLTLITFHQISMLKHVHAPSSMLVGDSTFGAATTETSAEGLSEAEPTLPLLDESFSACLLVMDENFRLHEWIAYHYHVLPLRYLVIAVDPRSKESPEPVIDLFRRQLNMTILLWNDTDVIPWLTPLPADAEMKHLMNRHLARQTRFIRSCMEHLYHQNRSWTALWDTDEFIAFNGYNVTRRIPKTELSATSPPDMSEDGSVLRYLNDFVDEPCINMHRVLVGSKEDPLLLNESHPFDPRQFDSLRYRFQAYQRRSDNINGQGKCMLNVQKIPKFPFREVRGLHRPVPSICPSKMGNANDAFKIRHFIGSWEAYSFRDDGRRGILRSHEAYLVRASVQDEYVGNNMSPWMPAFVKSVGPTRAKIILQNAGIDPEYNASHKIKDW